MTPHQEYAQALTRRHFFRQGALGLGGAALASLLAESASLGAAGSSEMDDRLVLDRRDQFAIDGNAHVEGGSFAAATGRA